MVLYHSDSLGSRRLNNICYRTRFIFFFLLNPGRKWVIDVSPDTIQTCSRAGSASTLDYYGNPEAILLLSPIPPVPSHESCLTLSGRGRGRKADTAPIEGTLCLFIIDERRLVHIVTIDTIVETATELKPTVMGTKSREVLVPAIHASESSNHPTNLSFWTQDSGRVGTVMAPLRGARDGDSK
ncbi:hypothetical protein JG688_00007038 [Phytophthora aleatoria]|uniref:Uncharacterized protein n=1 Tax=Phytophthora aleatoria TaxID=2496075 RepID=A0A8J5IX72_9STRA|nr:hypothetical protein JG688_00007038 [Phytophthora aleatoria]